MTETSLLRAAHLAAADRIADLLRSADDARLATRVAACPDWTVRDLGAHLSGGVHDALDGRMDGAPGSTWTARHVAERRDLPAHELAAQVASGARRLPSEVYASPSPTTVWDLLVHEADLRETLGQPAQPADAWSELLPVAVAFRATTGGLANGLTLTTRDQRWTLGDGGSEATLDGDDYTLLRVLFSRRSRAQIAESVDGDVDAVIALGFFGPRDDDQPTPT